MALHHLRLISGNENNEPPIESIDLVGVHDTRKSGESWHVTSVGLVRIWEWAEANPELIFFHFTVSQEI